MMRNHNRNRALGPLLFALAAVTGLAFGACVQTDDDFETPLEVTSSCKDYCSQAKLCRDNVNEEKCRINCTNAMNNCQADEQGEALDKLDQCAEESCDDIIGCRINVGAKCVFGL